MSFGFAKKAPVEQKEARAKAVNAVAYASSCHSELAIPRRHSREK
jgi:hypothetical protein